MSWECQTCFSMTATLCGIPLCHPDDEKHLNWVFVFPSGERATQEEWNRQWFKPKAEYERWSEWYYHTYGKYP